MFHKISEELAAFQEIEKIYEAAGSRVNKATDDLNSANAELERLRKMKNEQWYTLRQDVLDASEACRSNEEVYALRDCVAADAQLHSLV